MFDRLYNASFFLDGQNLVCFNSCKPLRLAGGWPPYLDGIHHLGAPKSEMQAEIALRHKTSTATDLVHLDVLPGGHVDARSDRGPIALRPQ